MTIDKLSGPSENIYFEVPKEKVVSDKSSEVCLRVIAAKDKVTVTTIDKKEYKALPKEERTSLFAGLEKITQHLRDASLQKKEKEEVKEAALNIAGHVKETLQKKNIFQRFWSWLCRNSVGRRLKVLEGYIQNLHDLQFPNDPVVKSFASCILHSKPPTEETLKEEVVVKEPSKKRRGDQIEGEGPLKKRVVKKKAPVKKKVPAKTKPVKKDDKDIDRSSLFSVGRMARLFEARIEDERRRAASRPLEEPEKPEQVRKAVVREMPPPEKFVIQQPEVREVERAEIRLGLEEAEGKIVLFLKEKPAKEVDSFLRDAPFEEVRGVIEKYKDDLLLGMSLEKWKVLYDRKYAPLSELKDKISSLECLTESEELIADFVKNEQNRNITKLLKRGSTEEVTAFLSQDVDSRRIKQLIQDNKEEFLHSLSLEKWKALYDHRKNFINLVDIRDVLLQALQHHEELDKNDYQVIQYFKKELRTKETPVRKGLSTTMEKIAVPEEWEQLPYEDLFAQLQEMSFENIKQLILSEHFEDIEIAFRYYSEEDQNNLVGCFQIDKLFQEGSEEEVARFLRSPFMSSISKEVLQKLEYSEAAQRAIAAFSEEE